jgi:hypothetical protein
MKTLIDIKYYQQKRKQVFGFLISIMLFCSAADSAAQNNLIHLHFDKTKTKKGDIHFEMIHNLIIIPVFINGSDTLKFILDTGVSHTMITSMKGAHNTSFNFAREIELFGLGSGREVKAYHSFGNVIELPGVVGFNHNVIILKEDFDFLSQSLGTQIHGLIGYDVFDGFTVEIDYKAQKITLYDPKFYTKRVREKFVKKFEPIPLTIDRRKPFVKGVVIDENNEEREATFLIDCGASHALSLFKTENNKLEVPGQSLYTYIGAGLGGDIYGYIGRVKRFRIGDYNFKKPIATFPDEESVPVTEGEEDRGGSIGADIIKRFDVVIDYRGEEILLKPNEFYKDEFKYNLSGIDLTTPLPDVPLFQVAKIRKGSPAWIAGLEVGDQIVNINGIETSEYSLSNIVEMLQSRPGRTFRIGVRRIDETFYAKFTLEDPIK